MKENIERIFKEQLEHYELPYEAGAWESMSKRLDGTPSTPFYRKWWFAASVGTILVGSATYFALPATESVKETVNVRPVAKQQSVPASQTPVQTADETAQSAQTAQLSPSTSNPESQPAGTTGYHHDTWPLPNDGSPIRIVDVTTSDSFPFIPGGNPIETTLLPLALPSTVCQNESFVIENPNTADLLITLPNGKQQTIAGKKSVTITASEPGTIYLSSGKLRETIRVNEAGSPLYISMDASTLYENGIPTVKFDVSGAENDVTWETAVKYKAVSGNQLIVHPFSERRVEVTATSVDQNGCKVSKSESVNIQEYNLMAMEAFTPLGNIQANKLFMPFALTQRDVAFELTVYDPRNGGQVFQTGDATHGWDGVDARSGELVPANSTWMWKVVIKNPLPGEPKAYNGTITRL